ncbi:type I polyketide synthase [Streptomyces sp. NPDC086787]|uniref:type I polyketide synthase n=1 Tax=Streptomyces sp. NPDC086787 TaxID=3365759 RepID=UPI0038158AC0
MTSSAHARIAVIGMAFRFPGADGPDDFWRVIRDGENRITRFTERQLAAAGVPEDTYRAPDFVGAGGVLDDIAGFDAEFFGISGREAEHTDPQHRLFLECAHHALENSGYGGQPPGLHVGVFASTGYQLYSLHTYLLSNAMREAGDDWLSRMQVMVGNHPDFTASRVAFRLGLTGPALGVQVGCSSSLAGVHLAAQSLLAGDCDIALAGATALHVPQVLGYRHVKGSILSRTGIVRAFDADADGTVGGTGVAAVVLKPLDRALADGDTVHGVISGWGITNDGDDKTTYSAPSASGQQRAVERALDRAGVSADSIGYLETHGTGTFKGDPIEFAGATAAFRRDTERTGYCALGSTKANIGHLDVCSGLASLIKAMLVLKHGVVPPMANFSRPNPALDLAASPFYIPGTARPWPAGDGPRRAGVTSLGVGGTNVHLILEEPPTPAPRGPRVGPPGVLALSGRTEAALTANARAFRDHLRRHPGTDLADLLASTAGRRNGRHRLAVRGDTIAALADALDDRLAHPQAPAGPGTGRPRVGFLFTGQGSAYPGMAAPLYERFPAVREVLDGCEHLYVGLHGGSLLDPLLAAPTDGTPPVWPTATAQPALYALQCALVTLWRRAGVEPDIVAGHSVGEYAALTAAGALTIEDGLRLTAERGRLMERHCSPGAMTAVLTDRAGARSLADEIPGLEVAVVNGEHAHVLAGPRTAVDELDALLRERGLTGRRLPVDRAFHTALMDPVLAGLRTLATGIAAGPVTVPFVSGLDGRNRAPGWTPAPDYLVRQAREPVLFASALHTVAEAGATALVEIGPGGALAGIARRSLPRVPALPSLRSGAGLEPLWDAAAELHRAGADIDWRAFVEGSDGRRIPLPGYRFQHKTYWTGPAPVVFRTMQPVHGLTDADEAVEVDEVDEVNEVDEGADMTSEAEALEPVLRHVTEVLARTLGQDPAAVAEDSAFFDLGADSLLMIGVLRELEETHQVRMTMRELFEDAATPRLLAELIVARRAGEAGGAVEGTEATKAAEPTEAEPMPAATGPMPPLAEPAAPAFASAPVSEPMPADSADHVTRAELDDISRQIKQLSEIQLRMMSQLFELTQLLSQREAAPALNGRAAK